jgi:hypothetical protein
MRGKDETLGSLFSYVDLAERIRSRFMPTMAADNLTRIPRLLAQGAAQ